MFGDRIDRIGADIGHGDSRRPRRREIDMVESGRRNGDQPQVGQGGDGGGVESDLVGDDDLRVFSAGDHVMGSGRWEIRPSVRKIGFRQHHRRGKRRRVEKDDCLHEILRSERAETDPRAAPI